MQINWNDKDPIYRQLRDRLVELILEGTFKDGDSLPSVRQIAADLKINPITVSKSMQLLVDEELVEKRRGLGMFVKEGAGLRLAEAEKEKFLAEEWPIIISRIQRLGLSPSQLLSSLEQSS